VVPAVRSCKSGTVTHGMLALVGGSEWTDGCTFDQEILAASGGRHVLVVPTAAAYAHPERAAMAAAEYFAGLGAEVEGLMVLRRPDAMDPGMADRVRDARCIYLCGASSLHLRSVLKGSLVLDALREAWANGAVLAGSSAGAMALTDPMVDPRGGALTVGLGVVEQLAVVAHFGDPSDDQHGEKLHRSVVLAPPDLPVAGIPERTALLWDAAAGWRSAGSGVVRVFLGGEESPRGTGALADPVSPAR